MKYGVLFKKKQLKSFESFVDNMLDDSSKHESPQMKMGKISLGVQKKSPSMAVRGELGMFPLTIDIYARIINYFFYLLELAGEGNTVKQSGVAECITLADNNQTDMLVNKCVILIQNYRDKFKAKNRATAHVWEECYYYSCQKYIKENGLKTNFFNEIRNSSKLGLYNCINEKFATERYFSEISYYKYR